MKIPQPFYRVDVNHVDCRIPKARKLPHDVIYLLHKSRDSDEIQARVLETTPRRLFVSQSQNVCVPMMSI